MSWKPEVDVPGDGWTPNGLVFATYEEAYDNARDAYVRWPVTTAYRAVKANDPVNYRWVFGHADTSPYLEAV